MKVLVIILLTYLTLSCTLSNEKNEPSIDKKASEAIDIATISKSNKNNKMKIEIWSDVICPFCLVGKKKMEKAIDKLGASDQVEIIWHSYQLDSQFPINESTPSIQNLLERKGYPADQVTQMCNHLAQQGKDYGIDFQFEKAVTFNTWNAHRLIQWSKTFNKSNELKEGYMNAHFSEGIDLSLSGNLLAVVEKVGLDIEKAKQVLESDEYSYAVKEDINQASQLGISGVPYFLIDGTETISGAQGDQVFENVISNALANQKQPNTNSKGGVCLPTGECK